MMLSFYVATHITPLENGDYEGLRTLKVKIFKHWNGKIKSKGMRLCFHVSTHITLGKQGLRRLGDSDSSNFQIFEWNN